MADPVLYIAGDVHLGEFGGGFPAWLDVLATRSPARLVLLGDLVEFWLESASSVARHAEVLTRIRTLVRRGWRVDLVRGNRELAAGRQLACASGCRMHWPALDLALGPVRLRIVHGDRLCHDPGYHFYAALVRSFPFAWWQRLHPACIQETVALWLRGRSKQKRARRLAAPQRRPRVFLDARRIVASARGCDRLIAGHIHAAWTRQIRGVDLTLVGDWPGRAGHWLEGFADGRLEPRREDFAGPPAAGPNP